MPFTVGNKSVLKIVAVITYWGSCTCGGVELYVGYLFEVCFGKSVLENNVLSCNGRLFVLLKLICIEERLAVKRICVGVE